MNILILGAAGSVGRRAVMEALQRGHQVTATGRNLSRLQVLPDDVAVCALDMADSAALAELAREQDVVINATRPANGEEQSITRNTLGLMQGLANSPARLLVVGGAASLTVPNSGGRLLLDDPDFLSPSLRHIGQASLDQYAVCLDENQVDWTYLCPPAELLPGERTGTYRVGRDELLLDEHGRSHISMEDLVVALLDEIEQPQFRRQFRQQRFTVAY